MSTVESNPAVSHLPTALVPGVLALLPRYASIEDPVAELRAACLTAVAALGPRVLVRASGESGARVGRALLEAVGADETSDAASATGVLVVGNGTAKRTEKAPGHLDERAEAFDAAVAADPHAVDAALAEELWADVAALDALPGAIGEAEVLLDAAPFGVQYWVAVWR